MNQANMFKRQHIFNIAVVKVPRCDGLSDTGMKAASFPSNALV